MPHKTEKVPSIDETLLISYGASGVTRTRDPRLRRPLLYPTELRAQTFKTAQIILTARQIVNLNQQILFAEVRNERVEYLLVAFDYVAFREIFMCLGKLTQLQIKRARLGLAALKIKDFLIDEPII